MAGLGFVATVKTRVPAFWVGMFITAAFLGAPAKLAAQGPPPGIPGNGPVVLEGEFEATYEDDEENDQTRLVHFLHSDNRRIPLRFRDGAPDLPTGARVRVIGDLAEGEVTATGVSVMSGSTSRTLGPQDVLVILFNFSDNATQPWSSSMGARVNDQVRSFYLENTYGQTIMSFTVVGYYTIGAAGTSCDYYGWATQAEAKATAAGVNLNAYDRRVFAFPKVGGCSWAGMGNVGGPRSWTNGYYNLRVIAHEQGHNFGDHHSKATSCNTPSSCSTIEYGDDRDVLGRSGVVAHMNAFQKERLGWLNYAGAPAARTVTTSGQYWIDNYETLSGDTKALKIWNAAKNGYYYVESRARMGFDANVAAGVTLHLGTSGVSYQVDLDPNTSTYDSTLDVGHAFTDASMGLTIETISSGVDGAMIAVTMQSAPCTTANPSVSLAASGTLTYNVTVKNNNSASCAASAFNVAASVPSGWSASFSPAASASLAPGATASATLTLTAPAGTSGSYPFSVTATDSGSGKSASASGSASVGTAVTSLTVTASATYEAGKGASRSATVRVSVKAGTSGAAGAAVSIVVTDPKGGQSTINGTADAGGTAILKVSLKPKDPSGVYQVQVTARSGGATGQAATSFTAQ
jgi:hypothetical protein